MQKHLPAISHSTYEYEYYTITSIYLTYVIYNKYKAADTKNPILSTSWRLAFLLNDNNSWDKMFLLLLIYESRRIHETTTHSVAVWLFFFLFFLGEFSLRLIPPICARYMHSQVVITCFTGQQFLNDARQWMVSCQLRERRRCRRRSRWRYRGVEKANWIISDDIIGLWMCV